MTPNEYQKEALRTASGMSKEYLVHSVNIVLIKE